MNKRVLLIAGGGTLGTHTANELLALGHEVDIICPEEKISDHPKLHFIRSLATKELLTELFSRTHYNGIVNFIHYENIEEYDAIHPLLIKNTDHLIFLSSYRVYDNLQIPITETAPRLYDVTEDEDFLKNERYAIPKAKGEDYLTKKHPGEPWTIVRPVISLSERRMDLYTHSGRVLVDAARNGTSLPIPRSSKDLHAGLDWAGNSGKLIANLLFKPETFGETYTVSSAQNLTWGEVAEIYRELIGLKVDWCSEEEFLERCPECRGVKQWVYKYDRVFDRNIDNSKILSATGLKKSDFLSLKDGIRIELEKIK
jgi:nucleoside-diphosphate-sugar epimerase